MSRVARTVCDTPFSSAVDLQSFKAHQRLNGLFIACAITFPRAHGPLVANLVKS
jgi:hypothetical protein